MVPAGRFLEATDADDRYSPDQRAAAASILGVAPNATKEEVRKAFRLKAFKARAGKRFGHEGASSAETCALSFSRHGR